MKLNVNNTVLQISAGLPNQFPADVIPQIALSGRSNVGKSSLINTLLGRKSFARVSSTPGKTITVNFYNIDKKLMLVDLPGYGFAKRTKEDQKRWSGLTDAFFTGNRNIDLLRGVVQLVDAKVGPTKDDLQMLDYLKQCEIPCIIVYTKTDKLNATGKKALLDSFGKFEEVIAEIPFSSQTKEGKDELWRQILNLCEIQ